MLRISKMSLGHVCPFAPLPASASAGVSLGAGSWKLLGFGRRGELGELKPTWSWKLKH